MIVISLGDDVRTVRRKIEMDDSQYHKTWRLLNSSAQEICHVKYGYIPLKEADTLPGILALKDHHAQNKGSLDSSTHAKIMQALRVGGAPAWIIHNAIKRNYEKHKKASLVQSPKSSAQEAVDPSQSGKAGSSAENTTPPRTMWDPARDV